MEPNRVPAVVLMNQEQKREFLQRARLIHRASRTPTPKQVIDVIELSSDEDEPENKRQRCANTDEAFARALQATDERVARPEVSKHTTDDEAFARALQAEEAPVLAVSKHTTDDEAFARALQAEEEAMRAAPSRDTDEDFARALQAEDNTQADAQFARTLAGTDGRPVCPYGGQCYRQSPDHKREFRHDLPQLDREVLQQLQRREQLDAVLDELDEQIDSGFVPTLQVMRGDSPLMMNKLASSQPADGPAATPHGVPLPVEVTNRQLHWHSPYLVSALLASFGVDYELVRRMVRRSPAEMRPGGVIIIDNYNHDTGAAGFDTRTHSPAVVVMPPFFNAAASSGQRARLEKGTMHPKLQILEFDGGSLSTKFLRVIIASANLGDYDGNINNQFWAHDFQLKGNTTAAVEPTAAEAAATFRSDLKRFVASMLRPLLSGAEKWAAALPEQWESILDKYDLSPPAGTHLILSIPGDYTALTTTLRLIGVDRPV